VEGPRFIGIARCDIGYLLGMKTCGQMQIQVDCESDGANYMLLCLLFEGTEEI